MVALSQRRGTRIDLWQSVEQFDLDRRGAALVERERRANQLVEVEALKFRLGHPRE